ncbi:hypothetical protein ILUMI_24534 [Ignelater luminosus]|uniref:Uncharacterized protein n=1 Tax=Ignelater luminosus TaxID=2038154 RepID=A0A8K0CCF5_IGNLU|nr:hypothetical protein ILUMI_24534 [Ignelater luminosus]
MLLIKLLFCLTILTAALSLTGKDVKDKFEVFRRNNSERVIILNQQVDSLLPLLNDLAGAIGVDPTDIRGFNASFKWTIFSGEIVLKDGVVYGVSTLERSGDVILKYKEPDIKITIPMGFSNLTVAYKYKIKFMALGLSGNAIGESQGSKLTIHLHLDTKTLKAKLDQFSFNSVGSLSFKFAGNGLTNWIVNLILPVVMPLLKPIIKQIIKGYIVDGIESILEMHSNAACSEQNDRESRIDNFNFENLKRGMVYN